ncbi:hypothetical protein DFS34DRAFT_700850 [Phlyctochytrium arcticum]|nr:hypothetical protein DFS34DRAFT_700850 [Phlyctochytrium arcticum]
MAIPPEPADPSEIKENLCKSLDAIRAAGTFAAFQTIPTIAPVSVREVGIVPFPITEGYARKLIDKARLAPFGKGAETVVDTSVRNTWELDTSELACTNNQEWTEIVNAASIWVAKELGISGAVRVEPYKMLIYEKGAMFKPHTDTEKIPGMFGTLVIALPSEHTGGDLIVKHRGEAKVFQSSTIQPCMLCWYSDVTHEVLPVTSGYRWVLTFNLATAETAHAPSANLPVGYYELHEAVRKWLDFRKSDDWNGDLYSPYYFLNHSYTEASIALNTLKGVDGARMQAFKKACEAESVSLYFGIIEKSEYGNCENWETSEDDDDDGNGNGDREFRRGRWHYFDDVIEEEYTIKKVVTTSGQSLLTNLGLSWDEISENNLIQNFEDPFDGVWCGEFGYSGLTGNEGVTATHWYRATVPLEQCANDESKDHALKMVHWLARILWYPNYHSNSTLALQVLEMSLRCRQYQLFNCIMLWFDGYFEVAPLAQLFSLVKRTVAEESFDFTRIKDRYGYDLFLRLLLRTPLTSRKGTEIVDEIIAPVIRGKSNCTPFALAALLGVMHYATADGFDKDKGVELCKPLLKCVIEALDVANLCSNTLAPPPKAVSHLRPASTIYEERIISTTVLVDCFVQCHRLQWDDLFALLCNKIAERANIIPPVQLRDLWIPFLQSVIPALVALKVSLATQRCGDLGVAIFEAWLKLCVGQEPSGRPHYQQKPVGCKCEDCNLLDVFLKANQRIWRFKALKWHREHLEDRLLQARADCLLATDRHGSPQTLVVTKGLDRGTRAKNAWTERFNAACTLISKFDKRHLNELLGDEYDRLVNMRHLRYPCAPTEQAPTENPAADDSPRGVKRKEL